MYGRVNREASGVDGVHVTFGLHDTFFVYEAEVFRSHMTEGAREGVDPEFVRVNWVANRDVAACAFVIVAVGAWKGWRLAYVRP